MKFFVSCAPIRLRIIKEKQRDLLDLLDGRLFPEFGVLDIETHEIRDIVYIAVIDNTEFEEKNILVNNDIGDGKANAGIILMQFVQGWETCIHLFTQTLTLHTVKFLIIKQGNALFLRLGCRINDI